MSANNQIPQLSQLSLNPRTYKVSGGSKASPIWQAAIDRYYDELRKGGVRAPAIDQDVWGIHSPDDLLKQIHDVAPADSNAAGTWKRFLRRLEPILFNLNDFAAVLTLALGLNGQVAAIIWGSISLIMKFARPVLPEVLDILEELGRALPRFRKYEQELPITAELEDTLLSTYTEIISKRLVTIQQ
ncbi:Tetratricopeptide-like helical [Penicillium malachiteum]|nr:Tetratricopeptide-like helical [Penicillium malachiteum]